MSQNGQLTIEEIVCGADGQWESISSSSCPDMIIKYNIVEFVITELIN